MPAVSRKVEGMLKKRVRATWMPLRRRDSAISGTAMAIDRRRRRPAILCLEAASSAQGNFRSTGKQTIIAMSVFLVRLAYRVACARALVSGSTAQEMQQEGRTWQSNSIKRSNVNTRACEHND